MKTTNAIVRTALARYLDRDPSTLHAWQHLEIDLFLSPRDVLRIVREVAEVEDLDLHVENLTSLATVGDLLAFVSREIARHHRRVVRWPPQPVVPTW